MTPSAEVKAPSVELDDAALVAAYRGGAEAAFAELVRRHQIPVFRLLLGLTRDADEAEVILEVEDSGPGITPEILDRLFEPFVTTRARGSGLGLAISRRLIEDQGGRLVAANSAAGGAVFSIYLPLEAAADSDSPEEETTDHEQVAGHRR